MASHRFPRRRAIVTLAAALVLAGAADASPWSFVGARAQAMGGAGVAHVSDSTANYWNPANLAFQKGWGVNLPVAAQGNIENDALEKLSNLLIGFDSLGAAADEVFGCVPNCAGSSISEAQRQRVASFLAAFGRYGLGGENVNIDGSLGLAGRYEQFGFSALSLTTGSVFPNTDLSNLGLGQDALDAFVGPGPYGTPANTNLAAQLQAAAAGDGITLGAQEAGHLVFLLEQAGANTFDPRVERLALGLVDTAGGTRLFSSNDTGALAAGLSTQEFAVSYALKLSVPYFRRTRGVTRKLLSMVHNKTAVSITPKYMVGVSFLKFYRYDDTESAGGIVTDLFDVDSNTVSQNFGLDVGLTWRPTGWLRFGMMARNVNGPSFDVQPFVAPNGMYVSSIEVDPQVRMGLAIVPVQNLTIAFDFDATSNELMTTPGFESRYVSLGAEYVIPVGRHVGVALRLGGYNNVSSTVEQDWAMTGGLGLRFGSFHLDLSAGGSFANETVRTGTTEFDSFPTRLNAGVGLSWEKSL
jgi:hypothetical protein